MNAYELVSWWERDKQLTEKDRAAIRRARKLDWTEIDEDWAETDAGRYELHNIIMSKYHYEEYQAGME